MRGLFKDCDLQQKMHEEMAMVMEKRPNRLVIAEV